MSRDIRRVLKGLIVNFKQAQRDDCYAQYEKVVVPLNMDVQKVWPILYPMAAFDIDNNWLEYTRYKDLNEGYDAYGVLTGQNTRKHAREFKQPIETTIKRLCLEHYKPESIPDSDTFLDDYPKHIAENRSPSTFPAVVLWYEFMLKLAKEPGSFIETLPLENSSKRDLPYTVKTQTIKVDVVDASIAALEYLLDRAEYKYRQEQEPTTPKGTKETITTQTDNGGGDGENLEPLSEKASLIYKKLRSLEPHEAMTTPRIIEWFEKETERPLDEGTFKQIRKELNPYGLKNKPRIGYYIQQK